MEMAAEAVNLAGTPSYDVADIAMTRGKVVVFATGYGAHGLRPNYNSAAVLQKPFTKEALSHSLSFFAFGAVTPRGTAA